MSSPRLTHSPTCARLMALFANTHGSPSIVFFSRTVKHPACSLSHTCNGISTIGRRKHRIIDRFRHTDHLRGLNEPHFASFVQEHRSIRIRCSEATRYFLSQLPAYKHLSKVYSLVLVNQPMTIQHPDDESNS